MCPDSDTLNLGVAGASSYWSYHNFKKCVIDLNYHIENAVMTFTDSQRLPITNPDLAGTAWKNVFRVDKSPLPIQDEINLQAHSPSKSFWDSVLSGLYSQERPTVGGYTESDIFSMWNLLFEDNYTNCDLANLISVQSLIKSIEIAKVKDINLVIILPMNAGPVEYLGESPDPDITNNFMIITGLEKVSHMETKTYSNGKIYNNDIIKEVRWKNSEFDPRCHHLCNTNNQVLADLISQGFDGQKGIHDLSEQPGLNFDEIEKYAELIYK